MCRGLRRPRAWTRARQIRGGAPGTGISWAHSIGTPDQPCSRAARAGKPETRSGVTVKIAETIFSAESRLARAISLQSLATAAVIAAGESRSTWTAPRIANIFLLIPDVGAAGREA